MNADHADAARGKWIIAAVLGIFVLTALVEAGAGRLPFGPSGKFGVWEGNIWSSENSQRIADPYSFSHICHGILFFGALWLVARRLPVKTRYLIAVVIEAGWETLENSPFIMNRYREATIALGYAGDSILNSLSDIVMMSLGFLLAWRVPAWVSVLVFLALEIGCALIVRDNLTLNVIMLIRPIEAIKAWQMGGQPMP